jgi:hypothetical protein
MACEISPVSAFQSTNLNSKIDCFGRLADRIVRMLGAPIVTIEIHQDQIFEAISIACEMFTKYAGYTREYLIFDSNLYERNKGIRLDTLYTLSNPNITLADRAIHKTNSPDTSPNLTSSGPFFIAKESISASYFAQASALSAAFTGGLSANQILDATTYANIVASFATVPALATLGVASKFNISHTQQYSNQGSCDALPSGIVNNMFDYDVMDYRKVIDVTSFEEGSTTGINTLFTIEQTLAQQTYFSYAMGNYGFDLVSWYVLKEWLEMREKLLATRRSIEFNDRTQYLRMYPEPTLNQRFYGVLACYVERPLRDIIKEAWVYQYASALVKIAVGNIRGKIPVSMFGGQLFSADLGAQGLQEKEKLETQLFTNAAGFGDADPIIFSVG